MYVFLSPFQRQLVRGTLASSTLAFCESTGDGQLTDLPLQPRSASRNCGVGRASGFLLVCWQSATLNLSVSTPPSLSVSSRHFRLALSFISSVPIPSHSLFVCSLACGSFPLLLCRREGHHAALTRGSKYFPWAERLTRFCGHAPNQIGSARACQCVLAHFIAYLHLAFSPAHTHVSVVCHLHHHPMYDCACVCVCVVFICAHGASATCVLVRLLA